MQKLKALEVVVIRLFEEEIPNLNTLFEEINELHFDGVISHIPCEWNTRMRTCAGKCVYSKSHSFSSISMTPKKIELSLPLFKNNGMDIGKITRTMQHEMTHAFLIEHFHTRS